MSEFLRPYAKKMAEFTDAPEIYHEAVALSVFGELLTRESHRCVLAEGVPRRWTNLWIILLGPSGSARKSTCIDMGRAIINRIDAESLGPDEMSPEGLIEHMTRRDLQGYGASAMFVQSEFSALLLQLRRQYAQSLRGVLLQFYDVPPRYNRTIRKKVYDFANPRASMLGGIAIELLADYGKAEDWLGGLFNRCMFILGRRTRMFGDDPNVPDKVLDDLAVKLGYALERWREHISALEFPPIPLGEAAKKVKRTLPLPPEDPYLYTALARISSHFSKIATIEQIDEDPESIEVGKAAAERALKFVLQWRETVPEILETCFARGREDFEGDRLQKRILRYLKDCKGGRSSVEGILRSCAMKVRDVMEALHDLKAARFVDLEGEGHVENVQLIKQK